MNKETLTREYIFSAFYHLLKKNNYDDISVCDITTKAGVSRMSFYRNFKSKDDLTFQSIDRIAKDLRKSIDNLEIKNNYTITKEVFIVFERFKLVINSFQNSEISKKLNSITIAKLKEDFPQDFMNKTSKYIPIYYFGAITSVIYDWLKNGCEETPDEMAKLLSGLMNIPIPENQENINE
ncbi:MAG: TetR/AcrR family transcriptional regulator [Clostridia bacterium]|nr:TetR/AcrR family transcriptional regulator [Clostridia bacterium]